MKKRLLIPALALLLLLVAAFVLTALSGRILKSYIEKRSGRNFTVESISFGWGIIEGRGIRILSGEREVATAKSIAVKPSLLTLFKKGFVLSRVSVEEPNFIVEIDRENRIVTPFSRDGASPPETREEPQHFTIRHLKIKNGILTINDRRPGSPAQLQAYDTDISVDGFSYPFGNTSSGIRLSTRASGKVISGRISAYGKINLQKGALTLMCEARDMTALQGSGSRTPQLKVARLAFHVASNAWTPLTISGVEIDNPFYRYTEQQKREIDKALPRFQGGKEARGSARAPVASIRGVIIKRGEIVVESTARQAKNNSPLTVVNMSATIDRLSLPLDNTASSFELSGQIPGRQHTANLRWGGKTAFGNLETDSRLTLTDLDLTLLKPYLEKKGEATVMGGTVDIAASVKIHNRYLDTPVTATIRNLQLAEGRGLRDLFMGVPRSMVLKMLETRNNEIKLEFLLSGSLDNPAFSLRESLARRFAVALGKSLGLSSVVGAGEAVIEQGARAVQGAGKGIKGIGEGFKRLFER